MQNTRNYWIIKDTPEIWQVYARIKRSCLTWRTIVMSIILIILCFFILSFPRVSRARDELPYIPPAAASSFLTVLMSIYGIVLAVTLAETVLTNFPWFVRSWIRKSKLYIGEFEGHFIVLNDDAVALFVKGKKIEEIKAACNAEAAQLISEYGNRDDSFAAAVVQWVRRHRRHPGMVVFGQAVHEIEESQAGNADFLHSVPPFACYRIVGNEVK